MDEKGEDGLFPRTELEKKIYEKRGGAAAGETTTRGVE